MTDLGLGMELGLS